MIAAFVYGKVSLDPLPIKVTGDLATAQRFADLSELPPMASVA